MLTRITSVASVGLTAQEVTVEVDVAERGFPTFEIVGLPDKAVAESRARVRKAIENSGCSFPDKRITVNLAPADLPKEGSNYDLPIAVGILLASGEIDMAAVTGESVSRTAAQPEGYFYGELGLDGSVKQGRGVLILSMFARDKGVKTVYVPRLSAAEGAVVDGITVFPVMSLAQLVRHLRSEKLIAPLKKIDLPPILEDTKPLADFAEIAGQETARRAAEIAAAGGHNLLLVGPPGAGKTLIAKAFPSILPPLSREESLEVTRVYSAAGMIAAGQALIRRRPYRSPHHTASMAAIVGGGSTPVPGEVSLAHLGVLFLDEMPEFPRSVLEVLRQPMEDGKVTVSRASSRADFPARFMLLASANPCPCGYYNHPVKECVCGVRAIEQYRRRISGPILDRIDLHVWVDPVEVRKLTAHTGRDAYGESSAEVRVRVERARSLQNRRFSSIPRMYTNAQMENEQVREFCVLSDSVRQFMTAASARYNLSARAYFKTVKVARTIADLSAESEITVRHMAEAVHYRESVLS